MGKIYRFEVNEKNWLDGLVKAKNREDAKNKVWKWLNPNITWCKNRCVVKILKTSKNIKNEGIMKNWTIRKL